MNLDDMLSKILTEADIEEISFKTQQKIEAMTLSFADDISTIRARQAKQALDLKVEIEQLRENSLAIDSSLEMLDELAKSLIIEDENGISGVETYEALQKLKREFAGAVARGVREAMEDGRSLKKKKR